MRGTQVNDRRIAKILTQVSRFSSGAYSHSLRISEKPDEIDATSNGLNQLRDSLHTLKMNEERIQGLSETLRGYMSLDFSQKVPVQNSGMSCKPLSTILMANRRLADVVTKPRALHYMLRKINYKKL